MADATPQPAVHQPVSRQTGIDVVRVIAALGAVWVHSVAFTDAQDWHAPGRWAVAFFTFVAGLFLVAGCDRKPNRPLGDYAKDRFVRLYVPFLFWGAFYMLLRLVKRTMLVDDAEPLIIEPGLLLTGGMHHLWFLPFLLIASVLTFPVVRWALADRPRQLAIGLAFVGGGLLISMSPPPGHLATTPEDVLPGLGYFLSRVWDRSPGFIWGVAVGLLFRFRPEREKVSALLAGSALAAAVLCLTIVFDQGRNRAMETIAGLSLAIVAFGPWPSSSSNAVRQIGGIAYGVYLLHPMFGQGMRIVRSKLEIEPTVGAALLSFSVSVVGAACMSLVLRRFKATRWMIP